jgi:hypothetical protein
VTWEIKYTLLCDGVWEETAVGMVGLSAGQCARKAKTFGFTAEAAIAQAGNKGWVDCGGDEYQCPACRTLSPTPILPAKGV